MKYNRLTKILLVAFTLLLSGISFTACNESISVGQLDENNYIDPSAGANKVFLTAADGQRQTTTFDFRNQGSLSLLLNLTQKASSDFAFKITYDASLLDTYNKQNDVNYLAFPAASVTFENEGNWVINKGTQKTKQMSVTCQSPDKSPLDPNQTYVIPLRLTSDTKGMVVSGKESAYFILIKDLTSIPDCHKSTGIKIFSCMEVNDTNPLNNLCFTLKNSKKYLVDAVVIFAANINYNSETGRVYEWNNENVTAILNNREKYIKPLQDRGMKVILGILGNNDESGVANLSNETARDFANELKSTCDSYHLDGVFFDDEYSKYNNHPSPGFVHAGSEAAARLCYETKKVMPDKLVCLYVYGTYYQGMEAVDGQLPGSFIDYALADYGQSGNYGNMFPNLPKSGWGWYSENFANISEDFLMPVEELQEIREKQLGAHMIFSMDPTRKNLKAQLMSMDNIAKYLFDDELVYDGKPYSKDW